MNNLILVIISFVVGGIFGYFIAGLMVMSKVSDLEYENMSLREFSKQFRKIE